MESTKTIVGIANKDVWERAATVGEYVQSTLDTTLAEVGFIHCSFPSQTLEIVNRKFLDRDDLVLLLIDEDKVSAPVKHEAALSGRAGTFPHIYGPLNVEAVYKVLPLEKDGEGKFKAPSEFQKLVTATQ
ncbi:MAG: DUF952 domain-containing protein [Candidatus Doudnabacteria bacterium]|nr:DUF952 domain-containing protein [Candidatus Doudnabacteria bacterium]